MSTSHQMTDPEAEFEAKVEAALPRFNGNKRRAVSAVAKANPALHKAYVESFNVARGRNLNKITGNPFAG